MRITSFEVTNYKSFNSSGRINFEPGFNVIVGQNNVGKTALAEALSLDFVPNPHRSQITIRAPTDQPNASSRVTLLFTVDPEEVKEIIAHEMPSPIYVPAGSDDAHQAFLVRRFLELVSEGPTIEASYESVRESDSSYRPVNLTHARLMGYEWGDDPGYTQFNVDPDSGVLRHERSYGVGDMASRDFAHLLANIFKSRVYAFRAVRFGINENPVGNQRELMPDASNLVQVLHLLQSGNPRRWERYLQNVRTVLPQVKGITFEPTQQGYIRALLWNLDPSTERDDLAVSISDSGTGVGQVLAILYVAFTSRFPRTIIIDEPQSFLHPGAVRKLFEILKGYPQHQYVITTHSPNAVTAADPQALFLVRKEEVESVVDQLDISAAQDQSRFLREVGASLSDVFGADNILWVEGPTEEECFPLILSKVAKHPLRGTKIMGVVQTGDFESKHSSTILEVYRRLSEGGGLLPPAIGFIFDQEERSEREREDLERQSGGEVIFTKRRMFENYLLNPRAIAELPITRLLKAHQYDQSEK